MAIDLNDLATAISQLILRFRVRRATAAQWTTSNEILLLGEIGYETDTRKKKIGDGVTVWTALKYDGIVSLVAGSNVTVDSTDPQNPIINATGGGGSGMTQLAQVITTAGQTSFTLMSSIPNTYRQLKIIFDGASVSTNTTSTDQLKVQFNGDSSADYRYAFSGAFPTTSFFGGSNAETGMHIGLLSSNGASSSEFSYIECDITNYAQNTRAVRAIARNASWQSNVGEIWTSGTGTWKPTTLAKVTSIVLLSNGSAFSTGSVATLYGVN